MREIPSPVLDGSEIDSKRGQRFQDKIPRVGVDSLLVPKKNNEEEKTETDQKIESPFDEPITISDGGRGIYQNKKKELDGIDLEIEEVEKKINKAIESDPEYQAVATKSETLYKNIQSITEMIECTKGLIDHKLATSPKSAEQDIIELNELENHLKETKKDRDELENELSRIEQGLKLGYTQKFSREFERIEAKRKKLGNLLEKLGKMPKELIRLPSYRDSYREIFSIKKQEAEKISLTEEERQVALEKIAENIFWENYTFSPATKNYSFKRGDKDIVFDLTKVFGKDIVTNGDRLINLSRTDDAGFYNGKKDQEMIFEIENSALIRAELREIYRQDSLRTKHWRSFSVPLRFLANNSYWQNKYHLPKNTVFNFFSIPVTFSSDRLGFITGKFFLTEDKKELLDKINDDTFFETVFPFFFDEKMTTFPLKNTKKSPDRKGGDMKISSGYSSRNKALEALMIKQKEYLESE